MANAQPTMTFLGTVDEVFLHRAEIPSDAMVELRVFGPNVKSDGELNTDQSLFDRYRHLFGTEHGLPLDLAERAEEYLAESEFGVTTNLRKVVK